MTRVYIQPSWINAAEDHTEWSGGNDQYRGDRSVDISTFDKNGRARVEAFSDEAIQARRDKKKTSVPLIDRVLPQQRRVRVLTEQLYELEAERKAGMDVHTYSQLRDILIVKRDRAQALLDKASKVTPNRPESYDDLPQDSVKTSYSSNFNNEDICVYPFEESEVCGTTFFETVIDELSDQNMFKSFLKSACKGIKTSLRYHQAVRNYIRTLKEV